MFHPPSIFEFTSLESFLTKHFYFRKTKNPHFSYQVWAHRMKINAPSLLCMVIKGTRTPSPQLSKKIKSELGLNQSESKYFDLLVDVKKNGHDLIRSIELMRELETAHPQKGFRLIEQDQFRAISNWYHYAILELVEMKMFYEDLPWLVRCFDFSISEHEIKDAIETLLRLGLLERTKKGELKRVPGPVTTPSDQADEGLKIYHEQSLKNAAIAIRTQNSSEREFVGLTLCIRSAKLPVAKKKLRTFIEDFCREFDGGPSSDQVYQLETCLFRLLDLQSGSSKSGTSEKTKNR